jgi:hypothetical protein
MMKIAGKMYGHEWKQASSAGALTGVWTFSTCVALADRAGVTLMVGVALADGAVGAAGGAGAGVTVRESLWPPARQAVRSRGSASEKQMRASTGASILAESSVASGSTR